MQVPFFRHSLDAGDANKIAAVLATPFLTSAGVGKEVERQLAEYFSVPHALLVNSWTNGAVATLLALGVGPGDEVIVPAMTFIATANVVELLGAKAVIVDVEPDTQLIGFEAVRRALTPRTRCVVPVHLYGAMVDVAALRREALSDRPDVAILEDAAHCFEGRLNGDRPGAHSDAAVFSFYATKNVTCGEGGAIVTRRDDLRDALVQTRLHGMSAGAADRFNAGRYRHWDMARLGAKANLPDLLAALLPDQIRDVEAQLAKREDLIQRYKQGIASPAVRWPAEPAGGVHARHLAVIHVPGAARDEALEILSAAGIGATVNYRAIHTLTYYKDKYGYAPDDFPTARAWGDGAISLPLFPSLTRVEQDYVIQVVNERIAPLAEAAAVAAAA